jgi:hypothetical protein
MVESTKDKGALPRNGVLWLHYAQIVIFLYIICKFSQQLKFKIVKL